MCENFPGLRLIYLIICRKINILQEKKENVMRKYIVVIPIMTVFLPFFLQQRF